MDSVCPSLYDASLQAMFLNVVIHPVTWTKFLTYNSFSILHLLKKVLLHMLWNTILSQTFNTRFYKFKEFFKHIKPVLTHLMNFLVGSVFFKCSLFSINNLNKTNKLMIKQYLLSSSKIVKIIIVFRII